MRSARPFRQRQPTRRAPTPSSCRSATTRSTRWPAAAPSRARRRSASSTTTSPRTSRCSASSMTSATAAARSRSTGSTPATRRRCTARRSSAGCIPFDFEFYGETYSRSGCLQYVAMFVWCRRHCLLHGCVRTAAMIFMYPSLTGGSADLGTGGSSTVVWTDSAVPPTSSCVLSVLGLAGISGSRARVVIEVFCARRRQRFRDNGGYRQGSIEVEGHVVEPLPNAMFALSWRTVTRFSPTSAARCGGASSASCPRTGSSWSCLPTT